MQTTPPQLSNHQTNTQLNGGIVPNRYELCSEKNSPSCHDVTPEDKFGNEHQSIEKEQHFDDSNCVCPISSQNDIKQDISVNGSDEIIDNTSQETNGLALNESNKVITILKACKF